MTMPGELPSLEMLRRRVIRMIRDGDVNLLTTKMVCAALEKEFGPKSFDKDVVKRYIGYYVRKKKKEESSSSAAAAAASHPHPRRSETSGPNSFLKPFRLSPELEAVTGHRVAKRNDVVNLLWEFIRENKLQDPADKTMVRCSGNKLYDVFKVDSFNIFTMNKAIKEHLLPVDEGYEDIDVQPGKKKTPPPSKRKHGFLTPYPISRALQSFLETDQTKMSRAEAVERVWDYVLNNKLMRSTGRHRIMCDDKLEELLKRKSVSYTKLWKLVSRHFVKEEEEEQQEAEEEEQQEAEEEEEQQQQQGGG